jgi:hypothetical protein
LAVEIAEAFAERSLGRDDALLLVDPGLIFPRRGGQGDYAAVALVCDLNSNSIGLT